MKKNRKQTCRGPFVLKADLEPHTQIQYCQFRKEGKFSRRGKERTEEEENISAKGEWEEGNKNGKDLRRTRRHANPNVDAKL